MVRRCLPKIFTLKSKVVSNRSYFSCDLIQLFFEMFANDIAAPKALNFCRHSFQKNWRKNLLLLWLFWFFMFWFGSSGNSRWFWIFRRRLSFDFIFTFSILNSVAQIFFFVNIDFANFLKARLTRLILSASSDILLPLFFFGLLSFNFATM